MSTQVETTRVPATTVVDLVVSLASAIAKIETATKGIEIQAPGMARKHLLEAIQSAQGHLMQAEDLAIRHVRELEARLKQE